jgi:hypothetical protein
MPRRAAYPMPVESLFHHPAYVALPAAGRGMLFSMCEHFWRSACHERPTDEDQLFSIARAHRPTWRRHRATILEIFDAWAPVAARYHDTRTKRLAGLRIAAQTSVGARRLKVLKAGANGSGNITATAPPPLPVDISPRRLAPGLRATAPKKPTAGRYFSD